MATPDEKAIRQLVKIIHDSPGRVMIVTAGAGAQALTWLLGVPGASRSLLEALTPYDESSFDSFLGWKPEKYVMEDTAGFLAGRAVVRARNLYQGEEPVIGLACTATIITDRPKRGQHRAHVATWEAGSVCRYSLHLRKGMRDRQGEEELVSTVIINALAKAYGLDGQLPIAIQKGDRFDVSHSDLLGAAKELNDGKLDVFGIGADGSLLGKKNGPAAILSGAFNPLHQGHLGLAHVAADLLGSEVVFELAIANAGKPILSVDQALERLLQFAGRYPVMASRAPLFTDKAELYPGATFVVGVDTAARVLQPRFYDDSHQKMLAALARIRKRRCRFLVAGRVDDRGNFFAATDLETSHQYADLFIPIAAERFRIDISSTRLRSRPHFTGYT